MMKPAHLGESCPAAIPPLGEESLQRLYTWIDEIPLSRPKKNISRDFADGCMIAEIVHHFFPRLVELHNYASACSAAQKLSNWSTLNHKVLRKLGFTVSEDIVRQIIAATPGVVELVLNNLHYKVEKILEQQAVETLHANPQDITQPHQYMAALQQNAPGKPYVAADVSHSQSYASFHNPHLLGKLSTSSGVSQGAVGAGYQAGYGEGYGGEHVVDLRETVQILELKVQKLEDLVQLKEKRIEHLLRKLKEHGIKP
eukprot:Sdes_comp17600_c0_seq1m6851